MPDGNYSDYSDGGNRKKLIIGIGVAAVIVLTLAVGGYVIYRRSHPQEAAAPVTQTGPGAINAAVPAGGVTAAPGQAVPAGGSAAAPAAPAIQPPVPYGQIEALTDEQKKDMGIPVDQQVMYKYVPPDPSSGMKAPVMLLLDASALPPPPTPPAPPPKSQH